MGASPPEESDLDELRATDANAIRRLFLEYGRGEFPRFVLGGVASVLAMAMELVPAYILAVAIDSLFFDTRPFDLAGVPASALPDALPEQFALAAGILAAAYLLGSLLTWVNSWAWNYFAQHFQHAVRVDTYSALQRRELAFFDDKQTGEVMSVLNNDVNQLEDFLTSSLSTGITIVVRVGGMGLVMLLVNWRLALLPVVVIPVLGYLSYRFVQAIQPRYGEVRSSVGELNSRLENNVGGIEVVKAFTTERFETDRVREASREYLDAQWDAITVRIAFWPAIRVVTAAGYLATFVVGGWWVIFGSPHPFFQGRMTAGTLVLFLSYSRRFMWPMRRFGQVINDYQYAEAAGQRIVGLLDSEPAITDVPDATDLGHVEGRVEYDDVSFRYDRAGDGSVANADTAVDAGIDTVAANREWTLADVSFTVDPGEFVGIVGPTGAGKTTLMKLLLRLYDPTEGTIRVDGTDVRDVSLESLRRSIGYVSQEPYLFYGTVRDNVAYGHPDADDDAIVQATKRAGAHEFVTELPDGYDTMVGERGVKLSGGQRQRLSIARTILRDPAVLILDEATSHVDNETEAVIQRSLAELTADRTTFAIAHRLSTVRDADRILVFDGGELVEEGTHEELLKTEDLYATLWQVQVGEVDALPDSFLERVPRE
jgi:ATP-binding cassette subfamily B protein